MSALQGEGPHREAKAVAQGGVAYDVELGFKPR